jgi:hypothetical protein
MYHTLTMRMRRRATKPRLSARPRPRVTHLQKPHAGPIIKTVAFRATPRGGGADLLAHKQLALAHLGCRGCVCPAFISYRDFGGDTDRAVVSRLA